MENNKMFAQANSTSSVDCKFISLYILPDGWLLCLAEGSGTQQTLPSARGGLPVLHRPEKVPRPGAAGGALSASPHLHQQAGGEAVPS